MGLVSLVLKRPYTVFALVILVCLLGIGAAFRMPTDIFPEINIPVVSIIWNYNGLPATEMGQRISAQNERSLTTTVEVKDGKIFALREYMDSHYITTLVD